MYSHVVTKFSRMGSLPPFLTHGALLHALCAQELRYNSIGSYINDHCFVGFVFFMLQHEVPVTIYEQQGRACLSNML